MAALLNGVLMANCLLDWAVAASPFLGGDLQQRTLLSSLPNGTHRVRALPAGCAAPAKAAGTLA